jgi:hypothetical protein
MNIARINKLRRPIHLMNTEPRGYEHFNEFNDIYICKALQPFVGPSSLFQFLDSLHSR